MLANYIFSEKFVKYLRSRDKQGKGSKYPSNGTSHLTDQSWTMWLGRLLSSGNLETVDTIMYWTVTTIWWENWTYKETSWECFVRDCHYDLRIYCFFLRELGVATSTCWSSNFSNTPTLLFRAAFKWRLQETGFSYFSVLLSTLWLQPQKPKGAFL